ncbi:MAG: hypothetical protein EA398_18245 [Deltaproteobacteria bacterium]|nr:MAG: hypothetical protein EA398_18245 [Deltaproteobacteria bacterium]
MRGYRTGVLLLAATLVVAFLQAGCGGKQPDLTIPLDEASLLNNELTVAFVTARELLEASTLDARNLGHLPDGLTPESFDIALTRHVLEACLTTPVAHLPGTDPQRLPEVATASPGSEQRPMTGREAVGRAQPCAPQRLVVLEAYLESVDQRTRDFIVNRLLLVDTLRVNLRDVLPARLDALDRMRRDASLEVERLRLIADERLALADGSRVTESQRRETEVAHGRMLQELSRISAVLGEMEEQQAPMQQLRRQLVDEAARNIVRMGGTDR